MANSRERRDKDSASSKWMKPMSADSLNDGSFRRPSLDAKYTPNEPAEPNADATPERAAADFVGAVKPRVTVKQRGLNAQDAAQERPATADVGGVLQEHAADAAGSVKQRGQYARDAVRRRAAAVNGDTAQEQPAAAVSVDTAQGQPAAADTTPEHGTVRKRRSRVASRLAEEAVSAEQPQSEPQPSEPLQSEPPQAEPQYSKPLQSEPPQSEQPSPRRFNAPSMRPQPQFVVPSFKQPQTRQQAPEQTQFDTPFMQPQATPQAPEQAQFNTPFTQPQATQQAPEQAPFSAPFTQPQATPQAPEQAPFSAPFTQPQPTPQAPEQAPFSAPKPYTAPAAQANQPPLQQITPPIQSQFDAPFIQTPPTPQVPTQAQFDAPGAHPPQRRTIKYPPTAGHAPYSAPVTPQLTPEPAKYPNPQVTPRQQDEPETAPTITPAAQAVEDDTASGRAAFSTGGYATPAAPSPNEPPTDEDDAVPSSQMAQPAPVPLNEQEKPRKSHRALFATLITLVLLAAAALALWQTGVLARVFGMKELEPTGDLSISKIFATAAPSGDTVSAAISSDAPDAPRIDSLTADTTSATAPATISFKAHTNANVNDIRLLSDLGSSLSVDDTTSTPDENGILWEFTVSFLSAFDGDVRAYIRDTSGVWHNSGISQHITVK